MTLGAGLWVVRGLLLLEAESPPVSLDLDEALATSPACDLLKAASVIVIAGNLGFHLLLQIMMLEEIRLEGLRWT